MMELHGIAIAPYGDAVWERAWLRTAMHALRAQGMVFLSPAEARAYLDGDEAAYWVWLWGETPFWPQVRALAGAVEAPAVAGVAASPAARPRTGCPASTA